MLKVARRLSVIAAAALPAAIATVLAFSPSSDHARAMAAAPLANSQPVLVELYQSQGCSDCPPANALLSQLADRPGVIALNFSVTYWDYLGWKDSFAKAQFTARQHDYANRNGIGTVYTPQFWINGSKTVIGSKTTDVYADIGLARLSGPTLSIRDHILAIGRGQAPSGGADIWMAQFDPRIINVPIRSGENGGRTLPHRNIVRALINIGKWRGSDQRITLPAKPQNLETAVFLQAERGGPIIAATRG